MIVFLQGTVHGLGVAYVDLNVKGVGYRIFVPESVALALTPGNEVFLYTHRHIREDADELFGFVEESDRDWFEILISVSGIGPKGALQIVSGTTRDAFVSAILSEDLNALCNLPGVGKKTGQRLILELKDKVRSLGVVAQIAGREVNSGRPAGSPSLQMDVVEALQALGYNERQAVQAASEVLGLDPPPGTVEEALRRSLQLLAR